MKTGFRKLLVVSAGMLLSACVSAPVDPYKSLDKAQLEEVYSDYFETASARLGIPRVGSSSKMDQLSIIIDVSFQEELAIIMYRDREPFEDVAPVTLIVSYRDHREDGYMEQDRIVKTDFRIHRYSIDLLEDAYQFSVGGLRSREFRQAPFVDKGDSICVDGTLYLLETQLEDGRQAVVRHNCDESYSELFTYADPLFETAIESFPELEQRLSNLRTHIRGN